MAKKTVKLPSISRVVQGATAILELPIGATYHSVMFALGGTAIALSMIGRIRVMANGKTLQEFKNLERLSDINEYHNRQADTTSEFTIHFKDDDFNELAAKRTGAFGTDGLQTFTIEVDINGTAPADITLEAHAFIDTIKQPLGVYTNIKETVVTTAAAGQIEYDKLNRHGAVYKQIHFFKDDIASIEFEADQHRIIDATKAVLERQQRSVRPLPRKPLTSKATHVDFLLEGHEGDMLNTGNVQDLRVRMDFLTAGVCEIVTEQFAVFS